MSGVETDDEAEEREASALIGTILASRYRIERLIGKGGMGMVFQGTDEKLGRRCAVKVLLPKYASSLDICQRLLNEARVIARVEHPNIVQVFDVGADGPGGRPYLVMQLLEGHSLATYLADRGPLPASETFEILMPVLAAMIRAHEIPIIHRDLKPENIFLHESPGSPRVPKILDFGIAKQQGTGTRSGLWLGTPGYTPPGTSSSAGPEVDQFSLAAILYECLAGRNPFFERNEQLEYHQFATRVAQGDKFPVPLVRPDLPPGLEHVIRKMLSADAADRFSKLQEAKGALEGALWVSTSERARLTPPSSDPRAFQKTELAGTTTSQSWTAGQSSTKVVESTGRNSVVAWAGRWMTLGAGAAVLAGATAWATLLASSSPKPPSSASTGSPRPENAGSAEVREVLPPIPSEAGTIAPHRTAVPSTERETVAISRPTPRLVSRRAPPVDAGIAVPEGGADRRQRLEELAPRGLPARKGNP